MHFTPESGSGKSADALMEGKMWEFKTVNGSGRDTVTQLLRKGRKQSPRVVLDLVEDSLSEEDVLRQIDRAQQRYGGLEQVWVLAADGRVVKREF